MLLTIYPNLKINEIKRLDKKWEGRSNLGIVIIVKVSH